MTVKEHPIQLGEQIPDTRLTRRWQAGREIAPLYLPDKADPEAVVNGCDEAARAGYHGVKIYDTKYVRFGGEWYAWYWAGMEDTDDSR